MTKKAATSMHLICERQAINYKIKVNYTGTQLD